MRGVDRLLKKGNGLPNPEERFHLPFRIVLALVAKTFFAFSPAVIADVRNRRENGYAGRPLSGQSYARRDS